VENHGEISMSQRESLPPLSMSRYLVATSISSGRGVEATSRTRVRAGRQAG
jgi:hypothetical protein